MNKYCPGCDSFKEESEYNKNKARKSGLNWRCRKCECLYNKEYRLKNIEIVRERERIKTLKKDPDLQSARSMQSRVRLKFPNAIVEGVDAKVCAEWIKEYMGHNPDERFFSLDHIVPLSKGGKHEPSNWMPLTHYHNHQKNDRTFDEWIEHRNHKGLGIPSYLTEYFNKFKSLN